MAQPPDRAQPPDGDGPADGGDLSPDEVELLAAFDRLRPQGGLAWGFDDAMHRLGDRAEGKVAPVPWDGLPDDLWARGRTAKVGQRFVGDVAGVLAELLAADARRVASATVEDGLTAAWDALRYLAARLDRLESRNDPVAELLPDLAAQVPVPDLAEWVGELAGWLGPAHRELPVVVGEADSGALTRALATAGHRVMAVEPRGAEAWRAMEGAGQGPGGAEAGRGVGAQGRAPAGDGARAGEATTVVLGEVLDILGIAPAGSASGAVLTGAVDRLDLAGKLSLLHHAVRVVRPGGVVVVLTTDQVAWDEAVPVVARDLAPGRPLHPRTWLLLLGRLGVDEARWHRPSGGVVHAVVGRLPRGVVRR